MTEQRQKAVRYSENSSQVSLWQFKTVIETGDVRYLLILDSYEEFPEFELDKLTLAWTEIYQEFSDIAGGNRADLYLVKVKMLTEMQLDFNRQSVILDMVQKYPIPYMIDEAKKEGYSIDINDFDKTFEKAYTRLMRLKNQISIYQKEREINGQEKEDQSLEPLIADLAKFQGYQFDEHKMNVKQFANIYKKYKDQNNAKVHSK